MKTLEIDKQELRINRNIQQYFNLCNLAGSNDLSRMDETYNTLIRHVLSDICKQTNYLMGFELDLIHDYVNLKISRFVELQNMFDDNKISEREFERIKYLTNQQIEYVVKRIVPSLHMNIN